MKTLVFDTETTGLPNKKDKRLEAQPYVIQLAAILYDNQRPVAHFSTFILNKNEKGEFVYPPDGKFFRDNGLTQQVINDFGAPSDFAMQRFLGLTEIADRVVAHNIKFDAPRIDDMITRAHEPQWGEAWKAARKGCTMLSLVDRFKLPIRWGGYKWPTLDEAYRALVDDAGFEGAHDAMVDVQATAEVLFAMEGLDVPLIFV